MSRDDISPEDLLILARQCKLEPDEERRFEVAVQSSRELEALYNAGVQFDEEASVLPGDETRSSALVERTLARLDEEGGVHRRSPRSVAVRVAVGLMFAAALAGAWQYSKPKPQTESGEREAAPPPATTTPPTTALPVDPVPTASATETVQPAPSLPSKPKRDDTLTASQLFARANELRRQGDIDGAISTYERLCHQYPTSVEAEDSKVLMGNLLLSQRSPRAALSKFEDYDAGALSLEALWGRAEALRKLKSPEERAVLEKLIRDYPNSAYAGAAQKRLREL